MRVLYLDCFSGISGDMTVGALCDLGVKPSAFEWELSKIEIGEFHAHWERQQRQQIEGVKFSIHEGETHRHDEEEHHHHDHHERGYERRHGHHHEEHEQAHEHHHEEHGHGRSYADIRALIAGSGLSEFVKKHAGGIFERIAIAEGKVHGCKPEEVRFHEVGGLDSIADVVLACVGIEALKVERIVASPLAEGRGWIDTAHGRFPVPAPATLEILNGIELGRIDEPFEFITPTGAAIVAEFASEFCGMPAMRIERIGYGVGTREHGNRPNVLRAVLGEAAEAGRCDRDTVMRVETNLDDLSPELVGAVTDELLKAGALDVYVTPIQMKKNRPGMLLTALCEEAAAGGMAELILRHTSSFGVRMDRMERVKLERRFETAQTPYGPIPVKIGTLRGEILQAAPEFEACREAAAKAGVPVREVYESARLAAAESLKPVGS